MPIVVSIGNREWWNDWKSDHPDMELFRALEDMQDFIHEEAVALAPGSTKAAIGTDITVGRGRYPRLEVGLFREPKYAWYVHEGTGIFGPLHKPIFAGVGNVFAWDSAGRTIFAKKTTGQRPQPFLREAVQLAEETYIPIRVRELGLEITADRL